MCVRVCVCIVFHILFLTAISSRVHQCQFYQFPMSGVVSVGFNACEFSLVSFSYILYQNIYSSCKVQSHCCPYNALIEHNSMFTCNA